MAWVAVAVAACAGRTIPADNASRPLHVDLRVSGWRGEEVRDRLERVLIENPSIGVGAGTAVRAAVLLPACSIGFHIEGEETSFGINFHDPFRDDEDDAACLRRLLPPATALLRDRLRPYRKAAGAPPRSR